MTAPQIKVKVQRRAQVKLKVLPRFPSNVIGEGGIDVDLVGGNYVISPGAGVLGDVLGPGASASVAGQVAVFEDSNHITGSGIAYQDLSFEYANRAAVVAATVPDYVTVLRTLGHTEPGDNGGARYFEIDIGDYTGAAHQIQSNAGTKAWSLLSRDVTPEMFGAIEGADCTTGFKALATWINLVGAGLGGCRVFHKPGAVYDIFPESDGSPLVNLMAINNATGVEWHFSGSRFQTDNLFATTGPSLLVLNNCTNFTFFSPEYREDAWSALRLNRGLAFININDTSSWSKNITIFNLKQYGGFVGVIAQTPATAGGYASNINIFGAEFTNVYYCLEFAKNGDNVKAYGIKCSNNGRSYVAYNVAHHDIEMIGDGGAVESIVVSCVPHPTMSDDKRQTTDIKLRYRNVPPSSHVDATLCEVHMSQAVAQMAVSAIASNGSGGSRLTVNSAANATTGEKWFLNVTGTTGINGVQEITKIDSTHVDVAVAFVGTGTGYANVPGAMKHIDLNFSCVNDEAVSSSPLLYLRKNDASGVVDTSVRGYEFSDFTLSGSVEGYDSVAAAVRMFDTAEGTWVGEDIHNINVVDFTVKGTQCDLTFDFTGVTNGRFENVYGSTGTSWTWTGASNTTFENIETPDLRAAWASGAAINAYPTLKSKSQVWNPSGDSAVSVGQGLVNFLALYWAYNATAGNATAQIATSGYSNDLQIDAKTVSINANNPTGVTDIRNSGALPTGTGAYVRANEPTITKPNIVGTATNDSAAAGSVGQYVESVVASGSAVALVTGTTKTVTSISLAAGDWDVSGIVYHLPAAATSYTRYVGSISSADNALNTTAGRFVDFNQAAFVSGGNTFNDVIPPYRISLAAPTTLYLVALGSFTVSTASAYGIIRARRPR